MSGLLLSFAPHHQLLPQGDGITCPTGGLAWLGSVPFGFIFQSHSVSGMPTSSALLCGSLTEASLHLRSAVSELG